VRDSNSQICYTNPKTKKMVTERLLRFIAEDRAKNPTNYPGFYDMTQMDNTAFMCLCPECRKVIAKYNRVPGGHAEGGDAGLQLEFINDVARTVRARYPDVMLRVFAYVSSECPPRPGTITVDPGVIIFWCDVYSRSDHTLPLRTAGHYNEKQVEEVKLWLTLTKNFHLWDYMLGTDDFPEVAVDAIAADAKFFKENALRYVFMETDYNAQPFFLLDSYVMSEFYLNPDADLEAALDRFCRYYGKGAAKMREAVDFLRKITKESPAGSEMEWHSRNLQWKNVRNMKKFLEFAVQAHEAADDPVSRSRVAQTVASANKALMKLMKADPSARNELIAAGERYLAAMNEYIDNGFGEPSQAADRKRLAAEELEVATLKFADRPAELEGVSDDELVFIDYHAAPLYRRQVDPKSTTGRAMVGTKPGADLKGGYPISCGMYDFHEKTAVAEGLKITAETLPPDGEYHWIKVGRMRLGRVSSFHFPWSWSALATLSDYYVVSDGAKSDPNRYDMWVSMRVAGPLFVKGSTEKDGIFLDRILLRRIKDEGSEK
jgi:hypothetical protein